MEQRPLGNQGLEASAQGLGCMGMSIAYGEPDDEESIATIRRALELGVNFFDTAETYGPHTNEELLAKALAGRRDEVAIATKFGIKRDFKTMELTIDGRPETVRASVEGSLERLETDHIDLYYQHRMDPETPIEETVGAMAELVEEGKVRYLGLSEAPAETIRRAHAVHPLTAVQSELSLWTRIQEENGVLDTCRELGIGFVAYSPLGRGFTTAIREADALGEDDYRRRLPRFQAENAERNREIVERIDALAKQKNATPEQLALAWVHSRGEDIFPIPGTKRRSYLEQNLAAFDLELSGEELGALEGAAAGVLGDRYEPGAMRAVAN